MERSRVVVQQAIRAGFADPSPATGTPSRLPGGSFERINITPTALEVEGWILGEHGALDSVEVIAPAGDKYVAERRERPDLALAFPDIQRANAGGYQAYLPASPFASNGGHEFTVIAKEGDRSVFNCRVVCAAGASSAALPVPRWTGGALHL